MGTNTVALNVPAGSATNICASQSPGAGAILLNGSTVSGGVATLDAPRRVTLTSGGNDSGINYTVNGTNRQGAAQSETLAGGNIAAVSTTRDFKTVTSITHSGPVTGTLTVGGSSVASSEWLMIDPDVSMPIGIAVVAAGTINYTVEYTYENINTLPAGTLPGVYSIGSGPLTGKTASAEGGAAFNFPVAAVRLTQNSATGSPTARMIVLQGGVA